MPPGEQHVLQEMEAVDRDTLLSQLAKFANGSDSMGSSVCVDGKSNSCPRYLLNVTGSFATAQGSSLNFAFLSDPEHTFDY